MRSVVYYVNLEIRTHWAIGTNVSAKNWDDPTSWHNILPQGGSNNNTLRARSEEIMETLEAKADPQLAIKLHRTHEGGKRRVRLIQSHTKKPPQKINWRREGSGQPNIISVWFWLNILAKISFGFSISAFVSFGIWQKHTFRSKEAVSA